jgi:glycosyltransferase involved in cell wall biosynthesis
MKNRIKILFIRPYKATFIQADLKLLQKHFDVMIVDYILDRRRLRDTIKTVIFLVTGIISNDVIFSWFADSHSYWATWFSRIFKRKSIVIAPGYEAANLPEIGYGAMLDPKHGKIVKYVLDNQNMVLGISKSNMCELSKYSNNNNIKLVYMGIDFERFRPEGKKENFVITVAAITQVSLKRKGIETFIKSAEFLQDVKFIVIGSSSDNSLDALKKLSPKNVEFTGHISVDFLIKLYQKSKVYCQLSLHEGFGVALAEAMSCQCIPVVTYNAALPEVVGDCGYYVPYGDPKATAEAIAKALGSNEGEKARNRIIKDFSIQKREEKLVWEIKQLVSQ